MMRTRLTIIWLFFFFKIVDVSASNPCSDNLGPNNGLTVDELIAKSSFVGLYSVRSANPTDDRVYGSNERIYEYSLSISSPLDNRYVPTIRLKGLAPYERVPPHYFATLRRHEGIPVDNPTPYGTTMLVKTTSDEECVFLPRLVIGYTYLIIGGVNSQISHEFVSDASLDGWHNAVKTAIKNREIAKAE